MRARLYAARFVSAPAQPRGRGPPYPAPELFCSCRSAGQPRSCPRLVPCAGLWVWSPSRPPPSAVGRPPPPPRRTPDVRSASGRCADSDFNFPVHAPNRTQHAPSISYRCRSRRSICRIGYSRAYPAVLRAGNPIHAAVRCPAPYAVVRVVSQMISMEPTRLRIAWLTSRFLRDAP